MDRLKSSKELRDIFLSDTSKELFEAFSNLNPNSDISELELEANFNRFFVGPDAPLAAPYASIYLDNDESLMTQTTMRVRTLYEIMGFKNPQKNSIPEDFLGLELDAYYQLLFLELEKGVFYLKDLRLYLLREHLEKWIFKFIDRVLEHKEENSQSINLIIDHLNQFFKNELKLKGELS